MRDNTRTSVVGQSESSTSQQALDGSSALSQPASRGADVGKLRYRSERLLAITERYGLKEDAERIRDRLRDAAFGLFALVIGEGNFGKSSLINALAERNVAVAGIEPKTFKVDVYQPTSESAEYALLRELGEAIGRRVSIDEAKQLCQQEEQALEQAQLKQNKYRPKLIETVWAYSGLAIGSDLCLVDTPGLAQFLLEDGVLSESMVTGLHATYRVDKVWALWYHRADVVLWSFQANRLKSDETYKTFKLLVEKYQKPIIPVATKADLIPQAQWGQIQEQFDRLYRPLLKETSCGPLFLTVTREKHPLNGTGVAKLREHLQELGVQGRVRKHLASEQFLVDCSDHIEKVLRASAEQAVNNLRTIADAADEIAVETVRRIRLVLEELQPRASRHIEEKIAGLPTAMGEIHQLVQRLWREKETRWYKIRPTPSQKWDLKATANGRMRDYLDLAKLTDELQEALDQIRAGVKVHVEAVSAARHIGTIHINQSDEARVDLVRISVRLPERKVKLEYKIPDIQLPFPDEADWVVDVLEAAGAVVDNVGKFLKGLFS